MKKTYIVALSVISLLLSVAVQAQTYSDEEKAAVSVDKTVTMIGDGSQYLLNLETFVKGEATYATAKSQDMDIVLVLDVSGSMAGDKLTKLKEACSAFITTIRNDARDHNAVHRIAVVKFAGNKSTAIGDDKYTSGRNSYNYSQIVSNLTTDTTAVRNCINALTAAGATRADLGLELAQTVLQSKRDDAVQCVIMFTDGTPTSGSMFEPEVVIPALSTSKAMKTNDVIVYTVGLFDDNDKTDDVQKYMSGVSSNYTAASATGSTTKILGIAIRYQITFRLDGAVQDQKYYHETSDAEELKEIFTTIGADIASENAGIRLPVSEVTLKDIITPQFLLPDGASSITLKVADIDDVQYSGRMTDASVTVTGYTWKEPYVIWENSQNVSTDPAFTGVVAELDGQSVNVQGFDFSRYWVGLNVVKEGNKITSRSTNTNGKKLIIEIIIQFDPSCTDDGQITTNAPGSGIYVGGDDAEPIVNYDVNPSKVYTPLPLKIVKNGGLERNESILYFIERGTLEDGEWLEDASFPLMTVALTRTSNSDVVRQTISALPAMKKVGNNDVFYYYRVTEDNTWSWAHKTAAPVVLTQKLFDNLDDYNSVEFVFDEAPDTAGDIQHAEAVRANEFGK